MRYRELGKTGLRVSEIGLGCEGFLGRDEAFTRRMFSDLYSPDPDMRTCASGAR